MGHVGKGREGKPLATKIDEFSEKLQKAKCLLNIKEIVQYNFLDWKCIFLQTYLLISDIIFPFNKQTHFLFDFKCICSLPIS